MKLFRYILLHDAGMAPCSDDGLLTLAVCKPRIRSAAKVGDWIAGFCPVSANVTLKRPPGMLAYIGQVRETLWVGEYERRHSTRADAIYRERADGSFYRKRPTYHDNADAIRKDLSAGVLILEPESTWYFGNRPLALPDEFLPLAARGVGHKVNGVSEAQIASLVSWLRECCAPNRYGDPRDAAMMASIKTECKSKGTSIEPRVVQPSARTKANYPPVVALDGDLP